MAQDDEHAGLVARRTSVSTDATAQHELSLRVVFAPVVFQQQQQNYLDHDIDSIFDLDDEFPEPATAIGSANAANSTNTDGKILFLDGLRGVATVLVVLQHAGYMPSIKLGNCAVDIFFLLSSFLLTWLLYKKSEQLLAQQASYRRWGCFLIDYCSKRFFRVYPLFAIVAVALWLLPHESQKQFFKVRDPGHYDLLKVLTFELRHRYHVFWTLPLEIAYYFLIPLISITAIGLGRCWWVPCLPVSIWIGHAGWTEFRRDHQPLSMHLPTFVCGSLAAIIYVKLDAAIKRNAFEFAKWQVYTLRSVEFVTFWLLLSVFCRGLFFHWFFNHPHQVDGGARFISFHVTILIIIEMLLPSALSTALEWNVLRHWGKVGFSVYLLHSFVIYAEPIRTQENYYDKLVSQFFLIHVVATLSFHLVEQPCQAMASRINRRLIRAAGRNPAVYSPVEIQEPASVVTFRGPLLSVVAVVEKTGDESIENSTAMIG
ncbi:hypothetical protein Gpo141_00013903 [Globisporangium polare]